MTARHADSVTLQNLIDLRKENDELRERIKHKDQSLLNLMLAMDSKDEVILHLERRIRALDRYNGRQ